MKDDNIELKWWQEGLGWGFLMYISMNIISPLITGEGLVLRQLLIGIPLGIIFGLLYGVIILFLRERHKKRV